MKKFFLFILFAAVFAICVVVWFTPKSVAEESKEAITEENIGVSGQATTIEPETQIVEDEKQSEHLMFKGVPINGKLADYEAKMARAGFSYHKTLKDDTRVLKGDFAGFKGCLLQVATMSGLDVVNKIIVTFPDREKWEELENDYKNLKAMLTQKYGSPAQSVEKFVDLYESTDRAKMLALEMDECRWNTTYKTPHGDIRLSIDHEGFSHCYVQLQYLDKANTETVRKAAINDL